MGTPSPKPLAEGQVEPDLHAQSDRWSGRSKTLLFGLIVAVSLTFLPIPRQPYIVDDNLSEKAVLSYANEKGLQYGKDIVFTYGPLGFLVSRHFFPHAAAVRRVVDILFAVAVSAGVCLVAWRLPHFWRESLVALFVFLASNIDPRSDLLLYVGLMCWTLLCLVETGRCQALSLGAFVVLAVFAMLVKANFIFTAGLCAVMIAVSSLLQARYMLALVAILAPAGVFAAGWSLSGQRFLNLGPFFQSVFSIVRSYDQAVALDGLEVLRRRGLLALGLGLGTVLGRTLASTKSGRNWPWRLSLLGWLGALLFVVWKHGFVRATFDHVGFFFGFTAVLALALEAIPCEKKGAKLLSRGLALACCAVSISTLVAFSFPGFSAALFQPVRQVAANFQALVAPKAFQRQMLELLAVTQRSTSLPRFREEIRQHTVDVFGQDQCYAIFNKMNYCPRPVFRSEMTYNGALMELNEQFYLSPSAPEYVIFGLNPIDRKFPPLEDARLLRHLMFNYVMVAIESPFLLVKLQSTNPPNLALLREGAAQLGLPISLKEFNGANLWMEISVNPTWQGKLRQFFYKPTKVRLAPWNDEPARRLGKFNAPPSLLAAGFLASPLLLRTQDVRDFYTSDASVRPVAYSVELDPGGEPYWNSTIQYRIWRIENKAARRSLE